MPRKDFSDTIAETVRINTMALQANSQGKKDSLRETLPKNPLDDKLVAYLDSRSVDAEYYSYLATKLERALNAAGAGKGGKVLVVTGPSRGSGKTVCALNLALAYAKAYGRDTLFMDGDARGGKAQTYLGFGESPLPGLTDVLGMTQRAGSVLINTGLFDLVFFPSGPFVEELLPRMKDEEISLLFDSLRQKFRMVVIDTPPAFPLPEAAILGREADGVLVVLRAGLDGETQLAQTLEALQGCPVVGAALNGIKSGLVPRSYYGGYGGYFYGKEKESPSPKKEQP